VQVHMLHGLAGCLTDIDADVPTVWLMLEFV
jgi:hypothetical protein